MLYRESLERDAANFRGHALLYQMSIFDRAVFQTLPRLLRGMHRARRTVFQTPSMIRMRMRQYDRAGTQTFEFSEPIKAAINHHVVPAVRNEQ